MPILFPDLIRVLRLINSFLIVDTCFFSMLSVKKLYPTGSFEQVLQTQNKLKLTNKQFS